MVARENGGLWGWVKKVKGLRSSNWQIQNSPGNVKYTIENTVKYSRKYSNNSEWILEISGGITL